MAKEKSRLTKDELSNKIGKRIKELRSDLGISQAELARRINKDPQHIELIENGKVSPNVYTLYILSIGLEVDLSELFKSR
jgi:transcriptional regulator with XRE-family HTH domain